MQLKTIQCTSYKAMNENSRIKLIKTFCKASTTCFAVNHTDGNVSKNDKGSVVCPMQQKAEAGMIWQIKVVEIKAEIFARFIERSTFISEVS